MSIISAEITKISLNSYITMKISFANTLANICENIPGASVDDITQALGADQRISPYYMKAGLGFGGPCFPRDNRAFSAFASQYHSRAPLAETTDEVNRIQRMHLLKKVTQELDKLSDKRVSILGLAYKSHTPVIEESPALHLIEDLLKLDTELIVYDPLALQNAMYQLSDRVLFTSKIEDCLSHSSLWVSTLINDEFKNLYKIVSQNKELNPPRPSGPKITIIDCWRLLNPQDFNEKFQYYSFRRKTDLRTTYMNDHESLLL